MDDPVMINKFSEAWEALQAEVGGDMQTSGFWDFSMSEHDILYRLSKIMLMVTELSELAEGLRERRTMSDHIEEFFHEEEELADTVIRIMDYANFYHLDVVGAILAKTKFNKTRVHKHGKAV